MIDLTFNNRVRDRQLPHFFYLKIIAQAAKVLKIKKTLGLSLNLVGASAIQALNRKHRNKNQVTDILSFGLGKLGNKAIMELGDIFICFPVAKKQATIEGITLRKELAGLIIHGFLHLLGYDHERSAQARKKMFSLQAKIINKLALELNQTG